MALSRKKVSAAVRQPCGLKNARNACYINCILQAVAAIHPPIIQCGPFAPLIHHLSTHPYDESTSLRDEQNNNNNTFWQNLFNWQNLTVCEKDVMDVLRKNGLQAMVTGQQHDAHEFLMAFLASQGKITQDPEGCEFWSLHPWQGLTSSQQTFRSNSTDNGSLKVHAFDYLHCTINRNSQLVISEGEGVVRWPAQVLFLHIDRQRWSDGRVVKDERSLSIPKTFIPPSTNNVKSNNSSAINDNSINKENQVYELCAVVEHLCNKFKSFFTGSHGHYITYRRIMVDEDSFKWFLCSDEDVREVEWRKEVSKAKASLLVYSKRAT